MLDEANKANLNDSINLLWDLINTINNNDIERAKTRIKECGYVAESWFIMKMLNYINERE